MLDALAFYQAGFLNVMPMGGTQGFNASLLEHLKREKVAELVLCLEGDSAGQAAAEQLAERLKTEGFSVRNIALPDGQDPLSLLPGLSQAELDSRFRGGAAHAQPGPTPPKPPPSPTAQPSPPSSASAAPRDWKYRKLSAGQGKLKVWVSVNNDAGERAETTLDLYSSRARRQEAHSLGRRLGLDSDELDNWLMGIMNELDARKEAQKAEGGQELFAEVEVPPMTPEQREAALDFLQAPDWSNASWTTWSASATWARMRPSCWAAQILIGTRCGEGTTYVQRQSFEALWRKPLQAGTSAGRTAYPH
jgi:hypothetical protein